MFGLPNLSVALQVACPSLSLSPETFTAAANAAVVTAIPGASLNNYPGQADQFNPYNIEDHFYLAAFIFEDVGVTAYKGAIANLEVGHVVSLDLSAASYFLHKVYNLQSCQRCNTHDLIVLALQNPAYASAAAGIMALEAGHAATIRRILGVTVCRLHACSLPSRAAMSEIEIDLPCRFHKLLSRGSPTLQIMDRPRLSTM